VRRSGLRITSLWPVDAKQLRGYLFGRFDAEAVIAL
jgi:hypothetical protein